MIVNVQGIPLELWFPKWVKYTEQLAIIEFLESCEGLVKENEQLKEEINELGKEKANVNVSAP